MKTLAEQFKNTKLPKAASDGMAECYAMNNYTGLKVIQYIIANEARLEHRTNLNSDDWKPGTIREFLHSFTQAYMRGPKAAEVKCFDEWTLNFWRIKKKPTEQEIQSLITVSNSQED